MVALRIVLVVLALVVGRSAWAIDGGVIKVLAASYSTAGDTVVIAGVANTVIRVYQLKLSCTATNTLIVKDSSPATLDYAVSFGAGAGVILDPQDAMPWYMTALGKDLVFNWSTTGPCSVRLWYTQG